MSIATSRAGNPQSTPSAATSEQRPPVVAAAPALHFLRGPYVVENGRVLAVPEGSKRLLAFIALKPGRVDRAYVAGTLWPDGDDDRSAGNLRSALWRLRGAGIDIVQADRCALWLDPRTQVDFRVMDRWAGRIIDGGVGAVERVAPPWVAEAMEILPGWYDDWVIFERERLRQRLLHALEALSRSLVDTRHYAQAIEAALLAVHSEPLRESAHRTLIEAHLAEGNLVEARRIFSDYRDLTRRELGIEPAATLAALVHVYRPW
jgi:DNA-binding SARP family transcriptional activator